jgi:beta-galactosidase-like protein
MRVIALLLCNICFWLGQCSKCCASDPPLKPFVLQLDSNWRFAQDEGHQVTGKEWYSENFNDKEWKVLKSGTSWERQGVTHHGFGWYRQKFFIPEKYAGIPVILTLGSTPSDDDLYINGTPVGGIKGPYKYNNWLQRTYTISPSVLHYGKLNTIAIRVWGGNLILTGSNSGLMPGPYTAELDPYRPTAKSSEAGESEEQNIEQFDLSAAQAGGPFEMVFHFPADILRSGSVKLTYTIADYYGGRIAGGTEPIYLGKDGVARGVVKVSHETAQTIYLRGRFKANLTVSDDADNPLYSRIIEVDHLSFARRDTLVLPPLTDTYEETPYGRLKLIDEVDCSLSLGEEPHPYLQSGFDKAQMRNTPGSAVKVTVSQILGKKARESENGWFAYRVGRGKLEPHKPYLLRIEYPEDKPRYSSVEVQVGQNYMDIGWRNGVGGSDPYDNWPLSKAWQSYDVIVLLDDETVGAAGTGSASAVHGFWLYFINKVVPQKYHSLYEGGPAISRIELYEIDAEKNAPKINKPAGLPQRVLMFDWEHQPDQDPADLVRYAKLMGYSAISPVIIKWGFANFSEPLNGYNSANIDDRNYWVTERYKQTTRGKVEPAVPGKASVHARYMAVSKKFGVDYVPRIEYGGSYDLPREARAIAADGKPAKPNRYAEWCSDLLNAATWDDLSRLIDHLIEPYAQSNPQLKGVLWRIRSNRMPISYSHSDLELFAIETGILVAEGSATESAAWASSGQGKQQYSDWWQRRREQFHAKLVNLLKSYRSDLTLYYFNWDEDKFSLVLPDTNSAAFLRQVAAAPDAGRAVYEREREERQLIPAQDYIRAIRSGDFGKASLFHRPDYGLHTELYHDVSGIQLLAPANSLYLANNPAYLDYFRTADGLAVSNAVSYDETFSRTINPKFEGNMIMPAGPAFSMAFEILAYFQGDARTLTYTVYNYGRGFADAHRRFAQAFLALPAVDGKVVDVPDSDLKIRLYSTSNGVYVGVVHKGYEAKKITIKLPGTWKPKASVKNLVTDEIIPSVSANNELRFDLDAGPMDLNAFLIE